MRPNRNTRRAFIRALPDRLSIVPPSEWPPHPGGEGAVPVEVWRSRRFLVQIYPVAPELGAFERISVTRTDRRSGITWDDLQEIKSAVNRGQLAAVEVFPPDRDLVNVANMRHLWILESPPDFAWKRGAGLEGP